VAEASKDTIYVDIDDDITAIIDKVSGSKNKIVALVLPKRATTLQSIVNMKLLKRSGDTHKKKLVLITSEAGLLPLAGAVKLHVAKTLQSKPTIPAAPEVPSDEVALDDAIQAGEDDLDEGDAAEADEPKIDKSKPVGELAGKKPAAQGAEETIDIDDDGDIEEDQPAADKKSSKAAKKDEKKLKIPDFNKFRTRIIIGVAALFVLIIGWYIANFVMPRAHITVNTDNVSVNTDVSFTADTAAKTFDPDQAIVPATEATVKKTDSEKVPATGKKNVGEKATGTVSLKLTNCAQDQVTVPAGTTVSNGGLNFITQVDITFNSVKIGNQCRNSNFPAFTTGTVKVVAQDSGGQYNISGGRSFSVAGYSSVSGFDSSAMSGGTDRQITVVSDDDVAAAKEKLKDRSKDAAQSDLQKQLQDQNLFALTTSMTSSDPEISPSPTVGNEASEVTVTSVTTYTMIGVSKDDLKTLVENEAKKQIDTSKQTIANDGIDQANYAVRDKSGSKRQVEMQSTVSTGAQENQDELKKLIAGKKKGDVQDILTKRPGVKSVDVKFSPFWVYKTPSNISKITIDFKQATDGQN
jgi:hypothetical protein